MKQRLDKAAAADGNANKIFVFEIKRLTKGKIDCIINVYDI